LFLKRPDLYCGIFLKNKGQRAKSKEQNCDDFDLPFAVCCLLFAVCFSKGGPRKKTN